MYTTELEYNVQDIKNKILTKVRVTRVLDYSDISTYYHFPSGDFSWLTRDETVALDIALTNLYSKKQHRQVAIQKASHKRQREIYKEIYK